MLLSATALVDACSTASDREAGGREDAETGLTTHSVSSADSGATSTGDDNDDPRLDVEERENETDGPGEVEFSYIWIANSTQGTVSKIDTETLEELGRYLVRPDGSGSPSRTSVGLDGDVAVANRSGGVAKIFARPDNCLESNGTPGIQTSTGATDILAWGEEECIAWYTPLPGISDNRAVAYTTGERAIDSRDFVDAKVWTSGSNGAADGHQVFLLNGDTGAIEETIDIEGLDALIGGDGRKGGYGGAVDADNNFWMSHLKVSDGHTGYLIRVNREDFTYQGWELPGQSYGMTVASDGRVWICGWGDNAIKRFDPDEQSWQTFSTEGNARGCMEDGQGVLWTGQGGTLRGYNVDTGALTHERELYQVTDELQRIWGIAIDVNHNVWAVPREGEQAYRYNVGEDRTDSVEGLVNSYTYSDMTGFALSAVQPVG